MRMPGRLNPYVSSWDQRIGWASDFPSPTTMELQDMVSPMQRIQFEGGVMLELLNLISNVTSLSQMTLPPLGLQTPSSTLWGGVGSGGVGRWGWGSRVER